MGGVYQPGEMIEPINPFAASVDIDHYDAMHCTACREMKVWLSTRCESTQGKEVNAKQL